MDAPLFWLAWPFAYYATADLPDTCSQDAADVAGLPVDLYQQAIQPPTDAQLAALDELAAAAAKAAKDIKASCPTELALTAPGRLAAMQQRLEALRAAVDTLQPPLEKFYGLLNDEQKARLNQLSNEQHANLTAEAGPPAQNCGPAQLGEAQLPTDEIDKAVHLTEAERAAMVVLQNATTQAAADLIKASCSAEKPLTPAGRLALVGKRLDVMLQAIKAVRSAMNDFYGTLSDEQKAKFEAIRPQVASDEEEDESEESEKEPEKPEPTHAPAHRTYHSYRPGVPSIGNVLRHLPF